MSTITHASATSDAIPDLHFDPDAPDPCDAPAQATPDAQEISVTVPTAELRDAVSTLRSVAARQSDGASLSGVRIDVEATAITVAATNLRTTHTIPIPLPAIATGEGMLLLPAALLADALRLLKSEAVTLTGAPDGVVITAGRTTYKICELAKDRYPTLPTPQPGASLTLPGDIFKEIVAAVAPSAGRDETYPMLEQVYLRAEGCTVQAMATDSYRLALVQFTLDEPFEDTVELVVPVPALQRAAAASREANGTVRIADSDNHMAIEVDGEQIVAQRAAGAFPNLAQILAVRDNVRDLASVPVTIADLHAMVRRAGTVVPNRTGVPLHLRVSRGELTVRSGSEAGTFVERLPVDHDGETADVGLAPAFIEEALRFAALSDVETTLRIGRPEDSVLFDSPEARYLLMPIKLTGPPQNDDHEGGATNDGLASTEPKSHAAPAPAAADADEAAPSSDPVVTSSSPGAVADTAPGADTGAAAGTDAAPTPSAGTTGVTLPPGDVERRARAISVDYLVSTLPDGIQRVVELSVSHHGAPHKCFRATLARVEVNRQDLGISRLQNLSRGTTVLCEKSVSRFSEKGLDAFYEEAVAELERRRPEPEVAAMFTPVGDDDRWTS